LAKNGHMAAAKFLSWMGLDLNPETPIEEIISFKEKSPAWRTLKIRKLLHKSRGHLRKP
jgi:hypothetical protein